MSQPNVDAGIARLYLAIISQTGVAAPTFDSPGVRYNTLGGGEPVLSYSAAGVYLVTFPNPCLISGQTFVFLSSGVQNAVVTAGRFTSTTVVTLNTSDQTGNLVDGRITSGSLVIMVFP